MTLFAFIFRMPKAGPKWLQLFELCSGLISSLISSGRAGACLDRLQKREDGIDTCRRAVLVLHAVRHRHECRACAVGETVTLLHPPLPLAGVSTAMQRGCRQ